MDIKELFQSIFDSSNERIKNPFIGSYITAFILYNWRPIFLLIFSNATIEDKIVVINHEYCCKEAILWPLAIAFFYILILPYLNLIFDSILSYSNSKKNLRIKASVISKLEQKKAEAKYEREIAEERAGTSEITELKNKIEQLSIENKQLSEQNNDNFERYNKSNEISKQNEKELKEKIENLQKDYNILESEFDKLSNDEFSIAFVLTELTNAQKDYFIKYGDYKTNKTSSLSLNQAYLELFIKYGLVKQPEDKNTPPLTAFGKTIYEYLKTKKQS